MKDRVDALPGQKRIVLASRAAMVMSTAPLALGPQGIWVGPLIILGIAALLWPLNFALECRSARMRPHDADATFFGGLYVWSVERDPVLSELAGGRRRGGLGLDRADGYLDMVGSDLRWRPGTRARKRGFPSFLLPSPAIRTIHVTQLVPGVSWAGCTVAVDLTNGTRAAFDSRNASRVRHLLGERAEKEGEPT